MYLPPARDICAKEEEIVCDNPCGQSVDFVWQCVSCRCWLSISRLARQGNVEKCLEQDPCSEDLECIGGVAWYPQLPVKGQEQLLDGAIRVVDCSVGEQHDQRAAGHDESGGKNG